MVQVYCLTCKRFKTRSFKGCIKAHHILVFNNEDYHYHPDIDESRTDVWTQRFINKPFENIDVFCYKESNLAGLCPLHKQAAKGFCINCNRLICFEEKTHFTHQHFIFSDYGFELKTWPLSVDDELEIEHQHMLYNVYAKLIEDEETMKETADKALKNIFDSIYKEAIKANAVGNSTIRFWLNEVIKILNAWSSNDFEKDLEQARIALIQSDTIIRNILIGPNVCKLIQLFEKSKQRYENHHFINQHYSNDFVFANEMITKDENDLHRNRFSFHMHNAGMWFKCRFIEREDDNLIEITPWNREVNTYEIFGPRSIEQFDFNAERLLRFITPGNRLCIWRTDNETRTVIDYPYHFVRLISTYNTDIEFMGRTEDGTIYYKRGEKWDRLKFSAKYDNEIEMFVGSSFTDEPEYGLLVSKRYIHRFGQPDIKISNAISVSYDDDFVIAVLPRNVKRIPLII